MAATTWHQKASLIREQAVNMVASNTISDNCSAIFVHSGILLHGFHRRKHSVRFRAGRGLATSLSDGPHLMSAMQRSWLLTDMSLDGETTTTKATELAPSSYRAGLNSRGGTLTFCSIYTLRGRER